MAFLPCSEESKVLLLDFCPAQKGLNPPSPLRGWGGFCAPSGTEVPPRRRIPLPRRLPVRRPARRPAPAPKPPKPTPKPAPKPAPAPAPCPA